ncbi:VanW family protein [Euzebya pacifica]|uniref:VanW family protein n=1 Tax=Euzebya pacifica TaxID=1608957 RepID=UPI0030F4FF0B
MDTTQDAVDRGTGRRATSGPRRRPPQRGSSRSPVRGAIATVVALLVVLAVVFLGLRAARADTALPGITVAGVDVGGQSPEEVTSAIAGLDDARRTRTITVTRGTDEVVSTAEELGYALDVEATVAAVMDRGRQANPLLAFRDQVRATFVPLTVPPIAAFDSIAFERWIDRIADDLALPPIEADLVITGTTVEVVQPQPGETIDVEALRSAALEALQDGGDAAIEVPTVVTTPSTDPEAIADLAAAAELAISAPVTLIRGDVRLSLTGERIGALLQVRAEAVSEGGDADLELVIDPDRLLAMLPAEQFAALAQPPQDASIEVTGGQVVVTPSVDGFAFDAVAAAEQVLEVATTPGPRSAELTGELTEPEVTTEDIEAMGIVEQVATFTTEHPCCQSRVTNIQRMADIVRGTIVMPGETFSLNGLVGPRTTDKGFVGGGAISGGEFVEQIGGGVSQFTTTMFNTIYFGGYDIVEFKPHSYYISRYPLGREATLNYDPPVDLKFTNDSPHAIWIDTGYTDTSITVSFWSTEYAEVTSTTGDRYGLREPREEREESDELPAGEERVVQSGRDGFSVDFTRTIAYVDGRTATETYTTVYLAEPRIVMVGTGDGQDDEEPTEEPTEPAPGPTEGPDPEPTPPAPAPTDEPAPAPAPSAAPEPAPSDGGAG